MKRNLEKILLVGALGLIGCNPIEPAEDVGRVMYGYCDGDFSDYELDEVELFLYNPDCELFNAVK